MRANELLKRNIDALLRARGQRQKDLAQWCRKGESWISKIMTTDSREFPLKYWDRISDFFGIATYQLIQPGINHLTERRKGRERRTGQDRRISHITGLIRRAEFTKIQPSDATTLGRLNRLPPDERERVEEAIDVALRAVEIEQRAERTTAGARVPSASPAKSTRSTPARRVKRPDR